MRAGRPRDASRADLPRWVTEIKARFYLRIPEDVAIPPKWKRLYGLGAERTAAIRRAERFHRVLDSHATGRT